MNLDELNARIVALEEQVAAAGYPAVTYKRRAEEAEAATFRAKREAEDYRVMGKAQERELRDAQATLVRLRLVVDLAAECADIHNDKSPYNCDEALYRAVRAYQQSSEHAKGDCE